MFQLTQSMIKSSFNDVQAATFLQVFTMKEIKLNSFMKIIIAKNVRLLIIEQNGRCGVVW